MCIKVIIHKHRQICGVDFYEFGKGTFFTIAKALHFIIKAALHWKGICIYAFNAFGMSFILTCNKAPGCPLPNWMCRVPLMLGSCFHRQALLYEEQWGGHGETSHVGLSVVTVECGGWDREGQLCRRIEHCWSVLCVYKTDPASNENGRLQVWNVAWTWKWLLIH